MEVWKSIPNYEGLYEVSNLGRVKSLANNKNRKERFLKPCISKTGYYYIGLYKNAIVKKYKAHQLVAISFLNHTPCGHDLVVDHINDNKIDNRVDNLQIVTTRFNSHKTQDNYSSKYKGVNWHKASKKWTSQIIINKKKIYLGLFKCELSAHITYINKLKENHETLFHKA